MAINTSVKLAFKEVNTFGWNLGGSVFRGSLLRESGLDFFSPLRGFFSFFDLGAASWSPAWSALPAYEPSTGSQSVPLD